MNTNEKPAISCEDALLLLEDDPASPELNDHLARCADCRAEARVRAMMRRLYAEVPAGLNDSVMDTIRAHRVREASRLRWMRRVGALAAAAVLVPVAVILAPILLRADRAAVLDTQAAEQTISVEENVTTVPETMVIFTAAAGTVPETVPETTAEKAPPEKTSPTTAAAEAASNSTAETTKALMFAVPPIVLQGDLVTTEAAPPSSAPSYVTKKQSDTSEKSGGLSTMAADSTDEPMTTAPEPLKMSPAYSVIVSIAGAKEVQLYTVISASAVVTPAELCRHFSITREDFEAAAETLNLRFTDEELEEIFSQS